MAITYSVGTNAITVTAYTEAVPANFTDIYNADKAGTLSLHARTGIAGTDGAGVAVDRAERPTDYIVLGGASNDLYITVANWIGTTATIRITGTDRDGAAQTEDTVVNANGTYYTTKWFKTITHTQVTAFTATSFDYDLTQGQWGVVWKQGTAQYRLDMKTLQIGDGSTATWFKDTDKEILFSYYTDGVYWTTLEIKANVNFQLGILNTTGNEDFGDEGCAIWYRDGLNAAYTAGKWNNYGNLKLYGCVFNNFEPNTKGHVLETHSTGTIKMYDCISKFPYTILLTNAISSDIKRLTVISAAIALRVKTGTDTFEDVNIFKPDQSNIFVEGGGIATFKNCYMPDNSSSAPSKTIRIHTGGGTINIINPTRVDYPIYWTVDGYVYYKHEFDLKVIDKDNVAINGATVKVWDKDSTLIVDTTTNASGEIASQTVTAIRKTRNTTTTSITTTYSPFLIKIEKAGYTTYEADFTLDDKMDWLIALQAAGGGLMRNPPMTGGMV